MYKLEGTCRLTKINDYNALTKVLHQYDWQSKKTNRYTIRFWKTAPNPGSLHEHRGILHRALKKVDIHVVFGMVYYDKDASN